VYQLVHAARAHEGGIATVADGVQSRNHDELQEAQGTPGLARYTAFEGAEHWSGYVEAAANTMSGWHHHGDNTTVGYVLKGNIHIEHGPEGSHRTDIGEGEFFTVPAGAIHREGNLTDATAEAIVIRFGEGPPVFPADGPEPG